MTNTELIRQEIERRIKECKAANGRFLPPRTRHAICFDELSDLLSFIDSLQQEQPAKQDYKDCNGCEYNRLLKDQIGWQFRGCFGGDYNGKPIAEIELCPLKVSARQEQPEVDLDMFDKEVTKMWGRCAAEPNDTIACLHIESFIEIVRHFYELGLKARREE